MGPGALEKLSYSATGVTGDYRHTLFRGNRAILQITGVTALHVRGGSVGGATPIGISTGEKIYFELTNASGSTVSTNGSITGDFPILGQVNSTGLAPNTPGVRRADGRQLRQSRRHELAGLRYEQRGRGDARARTLGNVDPGPSVWRRKHGNNVRLAICRLLPDRESGDDYGEHHAVEQRDRGRLGDDQRHAVSLARWQGQAARWCTRRT